MQYKKFQKHKNLTEHALLPSTLVLFPCKFRLVFVHILHSKPTPAIISQLLLPIYFHLHEIFIPVSYILIS